MNENSIAELETEIGRLKKLKATKKNTSEIKRLKSALNKVYLEYKQKVINYEDDNYATLAFLRSTQGFYKLLEHSLLFYAFDVAPKLNVSAKIYADGDYELKSKMGIISIRNLSEIEEKLKEIDKCKYKCHTT